MSFPNKLIILPLAALLFGACSQPMVTTTPTATATPTAVAEEIQVKNVVEGFGKALQQVSITADPMSAKQAIQTSYQAFLTPTLITTWSNDPSSAIGKVTSSPWPDRIEISQVTKMAEDEYHVLGNVIQVTNSMNSSGTNAGEEPIDITVLKLNNQWLINQAQLMDSVPEEKNVYDKNGITIAYPDTLNVESGTGLGGGNLDTTIVKFSIPKELVASENTNFNEAYLIVSKSTKPDTISKCASFGDLGNMTGIAESVTINGIQFSSHDTSEGAAGNLYDSKLYRTVHKSTCYELAMVTHTGNINNYDPPVTEFNQAEVMTILTPVLAGFGFHD